MVIEGCGKQLLSGWRLDTSGVPQWSILRPVLFSIFISDIGSGFSTPLTSLVTTRRWVMQLIQQKDLEVWKVGPRQYSEVQHGWMRLYLIQGKPRYVPRLVKELNESSPAVKDLEILVDEKLGVSQQCAFATQK